MQSRNLSFPLVTILAAALAIFIIPLKTASVVGVPEMPAMFSSSPLVLFIINWPVMVFAPIAGVLAMFAALLPGQEDSGTQRYSWLWILLFLASLPGMINASTHDFVNIQLLYLAALAVFAVAISRISGIYDNAGFILQGSLFLSAAVVCLLGVQQYYSGFGETMEYLQNQSYSEGHGVINAFLQDRRIFSTFALPNSLAGFLLLVSPPMLLCCWKLCGHIDPPKLSRVIFMPLLTILLAFVLIKTRSRSAFLCLGMATVTIVFIHPYKQRLKWIVLFFFMLTVTAGGIYIAGSNRGFVSTNTRLDYYIAAIKIFLCHPLAGAGWGDFFHDYMNIKAIYHQEAPHDPHTLLFTFATQCGITGLLVSLAIVVWPLWHGGRRMVASFRAHRPFTIDNAICFGLLAWTFHSMLDLNIQVPASIAAAVILASRVSASGTPSPLSPRINKVFRVIQFGAGLAVCILGFRMLCAEYEFSVLHEMCQPSGKSAEEIAKTTPEMVRNQLLTCTREMPNSPFPWATAARFMSFKGDLPAAEQFINEAIKRSPERGAFYFERYQIQRMMGKFPEAWKSLEKSRQLFPMNPKYREEIFQPTI